MLAIRRYGSCQNEKHRKQDRAFSGIISDRKGGCAASRTEQPERTEVDPALWSSDASEPHDMASADRGLFVRARTKHYLCQSVLDFDAEVVIAVRKRRLVTGDW